MAAHVLGDLAFQAACRDYPADAVALGEVAARVAATASAGVRASVQTGLPTATPSPDGSTTSIVPTPAGWIRWPLVSRTGIRPGCTT